MVDGDPLRLRQLLGVLLDNATRYSRPGGTVDLQLRLLEGQPDEGSAVELTVRDEGIGIPAQELPRVFDRHFRGEQARRHSPDGSGLGLGIARSLAQAHGGRLELAADGPGTRAVLRLPLASQVPAPAEAA